MSRKVNLSPALILGFTILSLVGLRLTASASTDGESANPSSPIMTADDTSGLDGLNATDRAAAEKQETCPVTDELLGSTGTPIKLAVKGRTVFLCCTGCKAKLMRTPDKYLEKLDQQGQK